VLPQSSVEALLHNQNLLSISFGNNQITGFEWVIHGNLLSMAFIAALVELNTFKE
jgi:hypothetical protein